MKVMKKVVKKIVVATLAMAMTISMATGNVAYAMEDDSNVASEEVFQDADGKNVEVLATFDYSPASARTTDIIRDSDQFTFHGTHTGTSFYAKAGTIRIAVSASCDAQYNNAPLVIDLMKANGNVAGYGSLEHNANSTFIQSWNVSAGTYYLYYMNHIPYGDVFNFAQNIRITIYNIY